MLSLFRINDPYRLVILFILLLVVRIPLLWSGVGMTLPEMQWMLIGEKLVLDGGLMYHDIWDTTAPLAVAVYKGMAFMFGNSALAYHLLASFLIFVQASIFNHLLLRNKAYKENSYVPAFAYVLLAHLFEDFMALTPPLMGLTFVLLAVNNIFKRIDNQTQDDLFLYTGIYLGIASLCYLPFLMFFVIAVVSLVLFSGAIIRRIFLLIHGFFLVIVLSGLYAYLYDIHEAWWAFYVRSWWTIDQVDLISGRSLFWSTALPALLLVLAIIKTYSLGRFVNYQVKFQQVMLFFLLGGLVNLFIADYWALYQLILIVPVMAFFTAHYLLLIRKTWQAELITLLFIVSVIGTHLTLSKNWFYVHELIGMEQVSAGFPVGEPLVSGKKILVLGPDARYYSGNRLATPFLNWQLASPVFEGLEYYYYIQLGHERLMSDLPEVIVDQQGIIPELFERMPLVARAYRQSSIAPTYYYRLGISN